MENVQGTGCADAEGDARTNAATAIARPGPALAALSSVGRLALRAAILAGFMAIFPGVCAQEPGGANEPSPANGPRLRELVDTLAGGAARALSAAAHRTASDRALAARLEDFSRDAHSLAERVERGATARELE